LRSFVDEGGALFCALLQAFTANFLAPYSAMRCGRLFRGFIFLSESRKRYQRTQADQAQHTAPA
jgi:hypothetical protein